MDSASTFMNMLNPNARSDDVSKKLEKALEEKEKGNQFFKTGNNKQALYHYNCALMYVKGLVGLKEDETKQVNQIKLTCNNNMAAVHLKDEKYNRVVTCCNQVLEVEPKNVKGLFRRGKAYMMVNDLDRAEADLKKAAELDPNDKMIQRELVILKKKTKEQDKKQQKFYSNLFNKLGSEPDEEKKEEKVEEKSENNVISPNTTDPPKEELKGVNKDEYEKMEDV